MIPVLRPTIDEQTKRDLLEVLDSGWWGFGPKTIEFEWKFAERVGARYAVAVTSCTAALDLVLKAYGISGGELITTPMTFTSDAEVGVWNGMDVTFADIDPRTLCLDPETVVITPETKAIIAVHSHGRLCDIGRLRQKFSGLIVEDCAHALGTPLAGQLGGDVACWSFQAVKVAPAGDGGVVTTNDESVYRRLRSLTWLGIEKHTYERVSKGGYTWDYDIVHGGVKAYMNDLTAVIALGQLRRLDQLIAKRQKIQARYNEAFADVPEIVVPEFSHTVQYYTMECERRNELGEFLAESGIATSVHFKPLSEMTRWKSAVRRPLPVTDRVWPRLLTLPCHDALTDDEQEFIIRKVREFYGH